jgi:PRC-barrel domain
MLTEEEAARFEGATLVSADGQEIGEVENLLTHAADNRAAWAVVTVGDRRVVVPLDGAEDHGGKLKVRYEAEQIESASGLEGEQLQPDEADRLYHHYGIDDSTLRDDSGFATEQGTRQPQN